MPLILLLGILPSAAKIERAIGRSSSVVYRAVVAGAIFTVIALPGHL